MMVELNKIDEVVFFFLSFKIRDVNFRIFYDRIVFFGIEEFMVFFFLL